MSNEVTIPAIEGRTRIMIPLDIPTPLLDSGAIELYASKLCGWKPEDEKLAIDAAAERIRAYVQEEYRAIVAIQSAELAKAQAIFAFDALFAE